MNIEYPKFEICPEMQRLRKWLTKNNIEWKDISFQNNETWVCGTCFTICGYLATVVNGYDTLGGYTRHWRTNDGLLELYSVLTGKEIGNLTADRAIEIIQSRL